MHLDTVVTSCNSCPCACCSSEDLTVRLSLSVPHLPRRLPRCAGLQPPAFRMDASAMFALRKCMAFSTASALPALGELRQAGLSGGPQL